ncbi:MAG: hypothetical protein JW941_12120, partial [Candidatus Coatesbacteria bacterium]|nr:hypothetical protein [Candidatus Coatesbacteria bacterium]
PDERGADYPGIIYLNDKRMCTLRPGEYCWGLSQEPYPFISTVLHREPVVDLGVPTEETGPSCSADGSPTIGFGRPTKPGEVCYVRMRYPIDLDPPPTLILEVGTREEAENCSRCP